MEFARHKRRMHEPFLAALIDSGCSPGRMGFTGGLYTKVAKGLRSRSLSNMACTFFGA